MEYENRYDYAGINPDAPNDRGYECGRCGYIPTNVELDNGSCPGCAEARRQNKEAK